MVFNELSIQNIDTVNDNDIDGYFTNFLDIYNKTRFELKNNIVYSSVRINDINLARKYLAEWRNSTLGLEYVTVLQTLCSEQITISELEHEEILLHVEQTGKGLLIAFLNDGVCLSFDIHSEYRQPILECMHQQLDNSGEYVDQNVSIKNLSQKEHIEVHREFIDQYNKIDTSKKLLENLEKLFPNLEFIDEAKKQIENDVEKAWVKQIVNKLGILNAYFGRWENNFNPLKIGIECVNESNKNKNKLKDDYTFLIQGNPILVTHHVYTFKRILDGRIYFYPCTETGKGYICSLTRKIENI